VTRQYLVGLTGGIGSGKSEVAAQFAARGADVLDADDIAHAISRRGEAGHRAVVEALDLRRELVARPRIVGDVIGRDEARGAGQLRRHDLAHVVARQPAAHLDASDLLGLGAVDDEHARHALAQAAALEQQRNDEYAIRSTQIRERVVEPRRDQRMQQPLEIAPERRIVERATAQRRAVELAVGADERCTERLDDGAMPRFAAAADRVRNVVGVQDVRAARCELRRHLRFAAADAAGETDQVLPGHRNQPLVSCGPKNSATPPAIAR
jgi:hypothetical protein